VSKVLFWLYVRPALQYCMVELGQGRWRAALHRHSSSRRHPEGEQNSGYIQSMCNSM
jgi:hypothetical protein